MGSDQSTLSTTEIASTSFQKEAGIRSESGRKQSNEDLMVVVESSMVSTDEKVYGDETFDEEYDSDSSFDDDDEEEDEEWTERLRILEDARNLAKVANFFLYPENPVVSDGTSSARCFFTRPSAPEQTSPEEEEEAARIREDALALKHLAVDYMHPEKPVEASPEVFGRNYFNRASAEPTISQEEADERAQILDDAQALKQIATDYLCPELPVATSDPTTCGRNYFSRPSAEEYKEDAEERDLILEEMKQLKQLAVNYLHPEKPVKTTDGFACGRNFFSRPSAEEYEEEDQMDDRDDILEDMKQLKRLAQDYLQPERPVEIVPVASCRNYFDRASAPSQEDVEEAAERAQILAAVQALKQLAVDYMHPEMPVVTSDPSAFGRNYFSRPSADDHDDVNAEECNMILQEMKQLKKLAVDYMHPEKPVETTDVFACGRNYFTSASAEEYGDVAEEREMILEEMKQLKQLVVDYMHPEKPVVTLDPTACARNYFSRPSAPEQEDEDYMDDREDILEEMKQLKKLVADYMHPEKPVQVEALAACRNFFDRPSAESLVENAQERELILQEMKMLKQLAVDYMHPEKPVIASDYFATGRNYFSRPSTDQYDIARDAVERETILEEMRELKQIAVDYLHPERPVETTHGFACGRNYFTRPSAEGYDDVIEERDMILNELKQLKQLAVDFLQPEAPVVTSDSTACGRNYFTRVSAEEPVPFDMTCEQTLILQDVSQLKQLAIDFLHPELPVKSSGAARNYFDRPSAIGIHSDQIYSQGHAIHSTHDVVYFEHHDHVLIDQVLHLHESEDDHSHHSLHFDMDETDALQTFKENLLSTDAFKGQTPVKGAAGSEDGEEGNLSRSPSCVLLYGLGM